MFGSVRVTNRNLRLKKPVLADLQFFSPALIDKSSRWIFWLLSTYLANDVWLQFPGEDCVDDAVALGPRLPLRPVDQVSVEKVKGGDEKLVGVLLLIPEKNNKKSSVVETFSW